jgi:hypothetical protein
MIPGPIGRLGEEIQVTAATINAPRRDCIVLTGTTQIDTIPPPFGGRVWNIRITLIPISGAVTLSAAGNILVGIVMAQNRSVDMTWSISQQKWFIESGV